MNIEFMHLNDTDFPGVDNENTVSGVDVYKYQNNFDYYRWQNKVSIKLLNVLWNSNYADVPYFDNDAERDSWFDSQDGIIAPLETPFNSTPKTYIQLSIPYNDAYKYNYVVVDMPLQTSESNPIDYEEPFARVNRWYYFISDIEQLSPNTTRFNLEIDYWVTFIHSVSINYLMLERGHAPLSRISASDFLANPIMNNEYLLTDDYNFSRDTIIQTSSYIPIGNGKKYVLFCAPYSPTDFDKFGGIAYSGNSTPASYEDLLERWGYQLKVNDYEWKYGHADYSNANVPITNEIQSGTFNGCRCFAIEGSAALDFFNECAENCVNFIHGIQAIFILDESLFQKTSSFEFRGQTIYVADKKINTQNISFSINQFGFDNKYRELAKLYTFPYSSLEITDDEGNTFSAKIENCGHVQMHEEVSLIYPFLNYNTFFSGINGDGTMQYVWKTILDNDVNKNIWASDFSKFMMNWKIPTYTLYVSSENEYAANNFFDKEAERRRAIKDYQNAVRYANTTRENVADTMETNRLNVASSGATNTSNINRSTQTNTDNVGRTGQTNTDNVGRSGQTNVNNTARTGATNNDNTVRSSETNETNVLESTQATYLCVVNDNSTAQNITNNNNDHNFYVERQAKEKILADYVEDNSVTAAGISATANNMMAAGVSNGISALASAASSGMSIGGVATAGIGFIGTEVSSIVAAGQNIAIAIAADNASLNKANNAKDYIANVNNDLRTTNSSNTSTATANNLANAELNRDANRRNATRTKETNNANAYHTKITNNTNAAATRDTNNANAAATQATNNTNAAASQSANDANAAALQTTNNANAERTQHTETDNATYNRNAVVAAEKANLTQKQFEAANQYKNERLKAPAKFGTYSGDFMPDAYQRRGVRVNIRTQPKSVIAQTGDMFLRFGYALHRVWDMSNGFNYMEHFTYWKAEDIWVNDGNGVVNTATNTIANILLNGVTVWRNPAEIGTVSIYEN